MSNLEDYSEAVIKKDFSTVKRNFKADYLYQFNKNGFTVFLQACHLGYTDIVKFFIEKEADLTIDTSNGWNGLHWAAGSGHNDVVLLLLEKGVSKESETNKKLRPLHCAALHDQYSTVRILLAQGCDCNARNKDNKTPLELATDIGNEKSRVLLKTWMDYDKIFNIVRQKKLEEFTGAFLEERVNVKEKNTGMTVVDVAVESKSFQCLEKILLFDLKENVVVESLKFTLNRLKVSNDRFRAGYRLYRSIIFNLKEEFDDAALIEVVNNPWILTNESFLIICVQFNRKDMVVSTLEMLIDYGQTLKEAEDLAQTKGFAKIKSVIVQRETLINTRKKACFDRLFLAIQDNRADVVRHLLLNHLTDANKRHTVVGVPLNLALSLGYVECVKALLDNGVEVNVRNKYNQTPLHIAIESGLSQFNAALVDRTNDVDLIDCFGFTALHLATINKDDEMCRLLLGKGAQLVKPLKVPQGDNADARLAHATFPLLPHENPVTLSLKLHASIMPSLLAAMDIVSVNVVTEEGSSFMHLAARLQLAETCTKLLAKGANVNLANQEGNLALHSLFLESFDDAVHKAGFLDTLHVLVDAGSNINVVNKAGLSPFRCAFQTEDRGIINGIIGRCDKLDCQIEDFFTVFTKQWPDVFETMFTLQKEGFKRQLIIHGIERGDEDFITAIFGILAADFVELILEECLYNSAKVDNEVLFDMFLARNLRQPKLLPCGQTLLTKLITENNQKYSMRLAKSDFGEKFLDFPNHNGQTPLYLSAEMELLKVCKFLALECHSFDYKDAEEETALEKLFKSSTDTEDKDKLKKVEEIVKTMIRAGVDITRVNKAKVPAITFCQNANLKRKLEDFDKKNKDKRPKCAVDSDDEKNICDICLNNLIDCQFGCGHPICKVCASQLIDCPKCRKRITNTFPLYLS